MVIYTCTYTYVWIYMYIYSYIWLYIYIYICMFLYVYVYTVQSHTKGDSLFQRSRFIKKDISKVTANKSGKYNEKQNM